MTNRKILYCILSILLIEVISGVIYFCRITNRFPQIEISRENLIGENGKNLKDFRLGEEGTLIAESDDPWSNYSLSNPLNIKIVKIFVDSVEPQNTWAQLYFISQDGEWKHHYFYIHSGVNILKIDRSEEVNNVSNIRFDLVSLNGASIKVDKIIINSKFALIEKYCFIAVVSSLFLILIVILLFSVKRYQTLGLHEVSAGVFISFALCFLLFFFAPLDLYFNNWDEFWFDVYNLFPLVLMMLILGAVAGCTIMLILLLLRKSLYRAALVLFFITYICSYIQGNFLIKKLPPLDGTQFNWSDYLTGRYYSLILWVIVSIIVLVLLKKINIKRFYQLVKYTAAGMTAMLMITLCIECITTYGYQNKLDANITTKNLFEMSEEKNFVILVLDMLDTETFSDIMEQNPSYKDVFEDFTYYPNTLGAYPFTRKSIPFILSGEWFENKELFAQYNENVYKNGALFKKLENEKYNLAIYETGVPLTDKSIFRFDNIFEYNSKIKSYFDFAQLELKFVGFKYAPFDLKRAFVIYTSEFSSIREEQENQQQYESFSADNKKFYDNIKNCDLLFTNQKCFKFIHINGAHMPFCYDKDVNLIDNGTYEKNVEASITIAKSYLEKLKNGNVYNNSIIIIMADHGYNGSEVNGRQDPLLLIKGINEHHEMQISEAPISYADLQTAYDRLLDDRTGINIFKWQEGDKRERRYLWQKDWLDDNHSVEYVQTGQASDTSTMYPTGRKFNQ